MSRSGAKLLFGEAADKASASVGKRTDYLAAGEAAGRKLTKSWQLGVSAIVKRISINCQADEM